MSTDGSQASLNTTASSGCSLGEAGQNKTNLSGGTEQMKIDLEKPPETPIQALIAHTITIESFQEAENNYSSRESKRQEFTDNLFRNWNSGDKFKANKSDSHSLDQSVLLVSDDDDLGLKLLFSQAPKQQIGCRDNDEIIYDLGWLFDDGDYEIDYNLEWLYGGIDIDEQVVEQLVEEKKKNKLYSIFLREPTVKPPSFASLKRKLSPQEEATIKMRRMTIETHSSPTLRTPKRRIRLAKTPGTRSLSRHGTTDGSRLKQALITDAMKSNKIGGEDRKIQL